MVKFLQDSEEGKSVVDVKKEEAAGEEEPMDTKEEVCPSLILGIIFATV